MKKIALIFAASSLFLAGCCTTHEHANSKWEYQTVVLPNNNPRLSGSVWTADDSALNAMLKDGWMVAGYSIDQGSSQWFLLKRHKQ